MEEKKNSQVQALDDDMLENVTGGFGEVRRNGGNKSTVGYDLSGAEIANLEAGGCTVEKVIVTSWSPDGGRDFSNPLDSYYKVKNAEGEVIGLEQMRNLLGEEGSRRFSKV